MEGLILGATLKMKPILRKLSKEIKRKWVPVDIAVSLDQV
jgi:hypothetical protein